jgi:nitrous oxide reductase accessory protein NosL
MRLFAWALVVPLWFGPQAPPAPPVAARVVVAKPGPKDLCPVCGMIVAKYPNWTATVVWMDGRVQHFDGAKDLFTFLRALPEYAPGRQAKDVRIVAVTEYFDLQKIEARQAYYVIGSDVLGPMGHEFVPFATRDDAAGFLWDHHGTRLLRFDEITAELIAKVDAGKF